MGTIIITTKPCNLNKDVILVLYTSFLYWWSFSSSVKVEQTSLMVQNAFSSQGREGWILIFLTISAKSSSINDAFNFPEESLQILEEQNKESKGILKFIDVTQILSHDIHVQYLMIQHILKHLGCIWISNSLSPKDMKMLRLALNQWKIQLCLKAGILYIWTYPFPYCWDRTSLKCQQVLDTWSVISH